jgi:hypothetical protein
MLAIVERLRCMAVQLAASWQIVCHCFALACQLDVIHGMYFDWLQDADAVACILPSHSLMEADL